MIRKLPKPAQEDGAAVGLAIAFQNVDQPEATLVRVVEPSGADVYRSVEKAGGNNPMMQQQMMMRGMFMQQGVKPPKPPRPTFPAAGETVRFELQREKGTVRFQVLDAKTNQVRYLGHAEVGPNDVAAVKLFASNRNGAEPVNVLLRDLTIRAERFMGLGTTVRTVLGEVVYADPTAIDKGVLILGGEPKAPAPDPKAAAATPPGAAPAPAAPQPVAAVQVPAFAEPVAPKPVEAPKPQVKAEMPTTGADAFQTPAANVAQAPAQPPKPKEPKAKIPLDEVESIKFERTPVMTARFSGQPNVDFTLPGLSGKKDEPKKDDPKTKAEPKKDAADDVLAPPPGTAEVVRVAKVEAKPNGVRDIQLTLSNLRDAAITQVMVNCQTDKGPTAWRIDTSNSQDWPLVVRRSGTEASADLFLEPPEGDCFQKDFTVNVTYADNQNANATAKADAHTDAKLALDPKASTAPALSAWVFLTDDEKLFGKLDRIGEESLRLTTSWRDTLDVPLSRVVGIHFALPDRKETPASFARRLNTRGSEDLLLAQTKDGEVVAIAGILEGTEGDKLSFRYKDKTRTLPLAVVEGLVMAARPDARETATLVPSFSLPGGVTVSGTWRDLDTAVWKVDTSWGQTMKVPAADVQGVRFRGGRVTFLSDLSPTKVEEAPYFGRKLPWRHDVGLTGEPLKMNGQTYEHGLAVHSRCSLTYDLNGRYATFEALVGFDEAAKGKGRVDCRVFADGKELYANPDLRADGPPVKLALPVAGAEQLRLLIDYGQGQDTGDRVIWANARLLRK